VKGGRGEERETETEKERERKGGGLMKNQQGNDRLNDANGDSDRLHDVRTEPAVGRVESIAHAVSMEAKTALLSAPLRQCKTTSRSILNHLNVVAGGSY